MALFRTQDKAAVLREHADDLVRHAASASKSMRGVLNGREMVAVRFLGDCPEAMARMSRARTLLKLAAIECEEVAAQARETVDTLTAMLENARCSDD